MPKDNTSGMQRGEEDLGWRVPMGFAASLWLHSCIERTFKDLDIEDDAVARWRPFNGKQSIVIDPHRSFGQPIASKYGVPTVALAQAVEAEGFVEKVAPLFDVSATAVRDAMKFEESLQSAA
ncbi:hypothetical protein [Mesorhizobium sp. M0006]|uniref:hypothetical protein n=1 Tax=Mesorhizobium sp. M0006 TaxID=2956838 RepID=UPI00333C6405